MGGSRRIPWLVFLIGVLAVVDVLGWVTWRMVRLEHEQARTRAETARQEAIGRALWRMDSIVLPILAVESARPYFEYQAFYPANRPFDRMWEPPADGDVLVPSPLLGEPGDFVQLHFERTADGRLTSPQAPPQGPTRDAAIAAGVPPMLLSMADLRLYELDRLNSARLGRRTDVTQGAPTALHVPIDAAAPDVATSRPAVPPTELEALTTRSFDEEGPRNQRRSIPNPFAREAAQPSQPGTPFADADLALGTDSRTRSLPPDESPDPSASPPAASEDSRAAAAQSDPNVVRESLEQTAGPADPRQDLIARQQAANYAQTYNDAGRSNRSRQYESRGTPSEEASRPAGESERASQEPLAFRELSAAAPEGAASGGAPPLAPNEPTPAPTLASPEAAARSHAPGSTQPEIGPLGRANEPETQTGTLADGQLRDASPVAPIASPTILLEQPASPLVSNIEFLAEGDGNPPRTLQIQPGVFDASETTLAWLDDAEAGRSPTVATGSANTSATRPDSGALTPSWRGDAGSPDPALVLTRTVTLSAESREQGVWIDWPALRRALESSVSDLFPLAEVRPLDPAASRAGEAQRLATIPVVLIPGPLADGILPALPAFWTPTRWTLLVGWIAVAIAVVAIGIVLRKAIDLGERRGRFVSAVTHELRTPLTTFRLYSQMLAGGTITDESKKTRYAQTLDRESQRLSGIVESVLEYARLGRRASANTAARQRIDTAAILDRVRPSLAGRCERAGMELLMPDPAEVPAVAVIADPDKLERILLNLVDNACKYAAEAPDRRIVIAARVADNRLILSVRDHGPGIPDPERRRIFNAFHRAKHHDQSASPGLGLGLALSRGLAREMGGELRLVDSTTPGAMFELTLPIV